MSGFQAGVSCFFNLTITRKSKQILPMSLLIRQRKNKKNKEGKENKKISGKTDYNEDELTYTECLAGALAERESTRKS